jgi:rhamnogalacturonan endolyase
VNVTWQTDAKHYQFWTHTTDKSGMFTVADVVPGTYTLYAYADGVLGEFAKADIVVPERGKPVDLGNITWEPVRKGRELWQVGIPNRTAKEFAGGDFFFDPDTQIRYAKLFPEDVTFVVGKSDMSKDWYYEHIPHTVDPNARIVPFLGVQSEPGKATPYRIQFDRPQAPKGTATLRLAICSGSAPNPLEVKVNDQVVGEVDRLNATGDSTIVRHNIQGIWFERELSFDASMMKQGTNVMTLTMPPGSLNNGVIYDCVRLELAE